MISLKAIHRRPIRDALRSPPSISAKCLPPPNNPNDLTSPFSPVYIKSINVRLSCMYQLGDVVLPPSMQ